MSICQEHNLRAPLPESRPYGIRVKVRGNDPFGALVGTEWHREHWFATRLERERALDAMSGRYVYFRPGDAPALDFERLDPARS
ncbi:MAG: hypothetical protein U1F08_13110 [Steroidobacteraceae bacterium]